MEKVDGTGKKNLQLLKYYVGVLSGCVMYSEGQDHLNERVMGFRDSLTKVEIDTDWLTKVHVRDNEAVSEGGKTT